MNGSDDDLTMVSYTLQEISNIKHNILVGRIYSDRVSFAFAARLYGLEQKYGEINNVLREIDLLEDLSSASSTKNAEKFKRPPLDSFWHKHFTSTRHMTTNVGIRWGVDQGKDGNKQLDQMIQSVATEYGDKPDLWQKKLVHNFYLGAFEERAGARRLTGDWIIYGIYKNTNYYIDIASHEEGRDPFRLYEKIKAGSSAEFPFLFNKDE